MDFFTVEVLTLRGLVRYFVLFAIDLKTRRVHIAGIVHEAYGQWMEQVARNLTDPVLFQNLMAPDCRTLSDGNAGLKRRRDLLQSAPDASGDVPVPRRQKVG